MNEDTQSATRGRRRDARVLEETSTDPQVVLLAVVSVDHETDDAFICHANYVQELKFPVIPGGGPTYPTYIAPDRGEVVYVNKIYVTTGLIVCVRFNNKYWCIGNVTTIGLP